MKRGQLFALITGVLFLIIGISGFIPGLLQEPAIPAEAVDVYGKGYGYLMGVFPVNIFHTYVHLIVGILGILASISLGGARIYGRGLSIFYGILAIMGLFPYTNTKFGLVPLFGSDVWLHAITAAIAFYFGFIERPGLLELVDRPKENMEHYQETSSES